MLITVLKDSEIWVREAAARALGQLGDARAVDPLITVLKDSEIWVREAAARALEQIGWRPTKNEAGARYWIVKEEWDKGIEIGAPAIEPLITALQDGRYSTVREAAAAALEQLGWRPDKNETGARYWIVKRIWNKCVEIGAPAVAPLITALQDSNGWVRNGAAKALVDIYQADRVGEASKRRILELREIIITSHQDHTLHSDWDSLSESSDCQHSDISHKDVGIGVYFPI